MSVDGDWVVFPRAADVGSGTRPEAPLSLPGGACALLTSPQSGSNSSEAVTDWSNHVRPAGTVRTAMISSAPRNTGWAGGT